MADFSPPYSPHSPPQTDPLSPRRVSETEKSDTFSSFIHRFSLSLSLSLSRCVFFLQESSLDMRTTTAVESLLSLRSSCGAAGSQWRPPSPAPSTSSERSVAATGASFSPVRPREEPALPSSSFQPFPRPIGGFAVSADGRAVTSFQAPAPPPSIVSPSLPLPLSLSLPLPLPLSLSRVGV